MLKNATARSSCLDTIGQSAWKFTPAEKSLAAPGTRKTHICIMPGFSDALPTELSLPLEKISACILFFVFGT